MDDQGNSFYSKHQEEVIFAILAAIAVFFAWAILRKKNPNSAQAQAASGQVEKVPVYIPTSETFISSTETTGSTIGSTVGSTVGSVVTTPPPADAPDNAHKRRDKPGNYTQDMGGGLWRDPSDDSFAYFEPTGHIMGGGFWRYFQNRGGIGKFGGPTSEEYRDPQNNSTRQDFQMGTMYWQGHGFDPNNWDVRWVAGAAGGGIPLVVGMTQPSPPGLYNMGNGIHFGPVQLPTSTTHKVALGDTLDGIGRRYGVAWQKIYQTNKGKIDSASQAQGHPLPGGPWNNIVSGMVLNIPAG